MTDFLLLATILLVSGVIAVPIATKLGLGSVLGYLIAGVVIAPLLNLLHVDVVSIQHFAEFGVVMMLFLVGLELEPKMLWNMRHKLLGLGGLQVTGTTTAVMIIAMLMGQPWSVALAIGLVFALSSTAIVLQTLNEKGLMKSDGGQASFSVLLFQDIAVIPMLALIPLLALPELLDITHAAAEHAADDGHGNTLSLVDGLNGWQTALVTVAAVAFVLFVGSYLTRPLFRFISTAKLRELFTATALMMVIGIALLMSLVGLSPALGTFLAGVVLANSEYRHELESDINPFKGLLLGLFFITVGASINFSLLFDNVGLILALTFGLMALKASVLLILGKIFRVNGYDRWLMAIGLAQAGEFGFVLLSFTVASSVIPTDIADKLMLVVALSMLFTPLLFIFLDKVIAPKFATPEREADVIDEKTDIIIIGHGRVGGIVNRMIRGLGYKTTVIDYSSSQLEMLRRFGFTVFFGDGTRPDLLHAAGIENAKMLVIAIDDREHITDLVKYISKHYPHVHIISRARDRTHVYDLWFAGCRDIVRETYDSSLRMGRSAYEALGYTREQAEALVVEFNQRDREAMLATAEVYKQDVPSSQNPEFVEMVRKITKEWEEDLLGKSVHAHPEE
ncbi:monovalent cation:proton antiporter-2 (CPA2) family protein [Reinekea sp. G2M2-21]|uniref:monovalent cation:proton antiporter-2 (CPA2) family protein n=1 Tax=Reinekea sp. G2M2-21 TaxID=2788942 RepID=UPI0018AC698A|nr:monovalent cation:proton antiporter-2 (CPA2) family protein [Reinekea sp. G2M2-21]